MTIDIMRSLGCMSWFLEEEMHYLIRENEHQPWGGPTNQVTAEGADAAGWQVINLRQILEDRDSLICTITRLHTRAELAEEKLRRIKRIARREGS